MTTNKQRKQQERKEKRDAAHGVGYLRIAPGSMCEYCELPDPDLRWRWLCEDCKERAVSE